ncbi:MAG: Si-specific NAD(P)(+) transhydrogenase, partial [Myxococcota bacterium]
MTEHNPTNPETPLELQEPSAPRRAQRIVVVGSGPAGEGAAMKAKKDGAEVVVVERHHEVGGACTHWATIPSKTLRHSVQSLLEFRRSPLFSEPAYAVDVSFPDLLRRAAKVIDDQVRLRKSFYDRNRIRLVRGHARFVDPHRIDIMSPGEVSETLEADAFIVATGSRPWNPPNIDFSHPRIFDSNTILNLQHTPNSISIYGAGVIGCEYASIFRNLGVKVDLINTRDRLLSFLDDEITDALSYHLRDQGCLIRHNESYASVQGMDDGVVLDLESGKRIKTDAFLWANGRSGNTNDLGLEHVPLTPDSRGNLNVDESYRTEVPHIYAVGDVIGFPSLASASYDQGRFAASHILYGACDSQLTQFIPTGIYTSP